MKDTVQEKYKGSREIVEIPEGTKIIDARAFMDNKDIKKVIIPDSVTQIKNYAFYDCSCLEEVVFSKKLTSLGANSFLGCKNLKSADLSMTKIKTLNEATFRDCSALKEVKLPKTLKKIGEYAFLKAGITELVIPASVEEIGPYLFTARSGVNLIKRHLYFEGTERLTFHAGGCNGTLHIGEGAVLHCKKDSELWKMLEEDNVKLAEHAQKWPVLGYKPLELAEL